ncbi:hypothetical protein AB0C02_32490 [Micromonospora sp. NPDC048999]|uniref:hypothetical protein n=1 Tax=Micromonospora sp. NPDC048999 TaxID=3155391 RepID=UPI0033D88B08
MTMQPRKLNLDCNYGVDTGYRRPPAAPRDPRGPVVVDLGGSFAKKHRIVFDWSKHATGHPSRAGSAGGRVDARR